MDHLSVASTAGLRPSPNKVSAYSRRADPGGPRTSMLSASSSLNFCVRILGLIPGSALRRSENRAGPFNREAAIGSRHRAARSVCATEIGQPPGPSDPPPESIGCPALAKGLISSSAVRRVWQRRMRHVWRKAVRPVHRGLIAQLAASLPVIDGDFLAHEAHEGWRQRRRRLAT